MTTTQGAAMYPVILHVIYFIGLKKQAVDLAVKWYATEPMESKKAKAGCALIYWQMEYPLCDYCTWPIYSNDPHNYCDEQMRVVEDDENEEAELRQFAEDEEARMAQQRLDDEEEERAHAEHEVYMASRCEWDECWEEAGPSGFCDEHERMDQVEDDYDNRDDEICPGICGQPAYACTCAETESFRRHQADPATRGSWWTP